MGWVPERLCEARTKKGRACRNKALPGSPYCSCHPDGGPSSKGTPSAKWQKAAADWHRLEPRWTADEIGTEVERHPPISGPLKRISAFEK